MAGEAGLWEWNHRSGVARLCSGAAQLLAGNAALAWCDLALDQALSRVHVDDLASLRAKLQDTAYPVSTYLGQFRVRTGADDVRQIMLRGRTAHGEDGEPCVTTGVVVNVTDTQVAEERWFGERANDSLDEAAHHGIAAYNAILSSGVPGLLAPARALLLAIGREISRGLGPGIGRPH